MRGTPLRWIDDIHAGDRGLSGKVRETMYVTIPMNANADLDAVFRLYACAFYNELSA